MWQKISIQGFVLLTGLMSGILLEARVFQPLRSYNQASKAQLLGQATSAEVDQANVDSAAVEDITGPRIHVDQPEFNFGAAETGTKVEHAFLIKNIGTSPLVIKKVQASCGCTTANAVDKAIEPGETTELKVALDLKARVGPQLSSITIKSNDENHEDFKLSISGTSTSSVSIVPDTLNFGRILATHPSKSMPVAVSLQEPVSFKILSIATSHNGILAELDESSSAPYLINVSVSGSFTPGPLRGWVKLLTDHPGNYHEVTFQVSGHVGPGGPILAGDELEIRGPALDGGEADLKALRGNVTVVVFWASWCGHCQAEMPALVALHKQYSSKGLRILGVNSDNETALANAAVSKFKMPWQNIHFGKPSEESASNPLMSKYQINGIPAIYLIDRSGSVKSIGLRNAALKVRVEQLLKEPQALSQK